MNLTRCQNPHEGSNRLLDHTPEVPTHWVWTVAPQWISDKLQQLLVWGTRPQELLVYKKTKLVFKGWLQTHPHAWRR